MIKKLKIPVFDEKLVRKNKIPRFIAILDSRHRQFSALRSIVPAQAERTAVHHHPPRSTTDIYGNISGLIAS